MRYKFRAWDDSMKNMVYSDVDQDIYKQAENLAIFFKTNGHNNIMQFTGLYDKNGKEIYEGDVLVQEGRSGDIIGCVKYEEIELNDVCHEWAHSIGFHAGIIDLKESVVLGNIYENPELIEG